MVTLTIGVPIDIAQLIADDGKLNPQDMRFLLSRYYGREGLKIAPDNRFNYTLKVDEPLKKALTEEASNRGETLLAYTSNLIYTYYKEYRLL